MLFEQQVSHTHTHTHTHTQILKCPPSPCDGLNGQNEIFIRSAQLNAPWGNRKKNKKRGWGEERRARERARERKGERERGVKRERERKKDWKTWILLCDV